MPAITTYRPLLEKVWSLRGEMGWVFAGQGIAFIGSFVGIKVLTNTLGPAGYGQLALGLSIAGILNLYLYGPVSNVVARFFSVYRERGQLPSYFAVLKDIHRKLALIVMSIGVVVAAIFLEVFSRVDWSYAIAAATAFGIVTGINASYNALQSAVRQRKVVAIHQGVEVWLRTGIAVLLVMWGGAGAAALTGYAIGTFLITISQSKIIHRNNEIAENWKIKGSEVAVGTFSEFRKYATSFMIFSGFAAISMYGDRWIIQGLFTESDVGIYAAIFQIASAPVAFLFTVINQFVTPIIFESVGSCTSKQNFAKGMRILWCSVVVSTIIMFFITLLTFFYASDIVKIMTNEDFVRYSSILWLGVAGQFLFNIGQLIATKGLALNKPRIYLIPKFTQAVSFLIFGFWLCKNIGVIGVAIAFVISSIAHLLLIIRINSNIETDIL